jgi:hypothetical protein
MQAWTRSRTVQCEAVDQIARVINDVEPPSLPFPDGGRVFLSKLRNRVKGTDEGRANVRHFDTILIADYFIAISEVEVVARWHEKLPCFS